MLFASPKSDDDRTQTAAACVRKLGIEIPALLDGIDNKTERAYTGWPDRLYIISREGRVSFKSEAGPYGFSTTNLEGALKRLN